MKQNNFDVIIIGSGQGGSPLALALAKAGKKVALVERKDVGGTCVNVGCTPTKTMVASARVAHLVNRAEDYGINTASRSVDFLTVRKRKRDIVESFRSGSRKRLLSTEGLSLLEGEASFTDKKKLEVNYPGGEKELITADQIIINTGTSPSKPPIPGLDAAGALDSTAIMELDKLPAHLIIIGGGYIGLEFGQMFRRFGSKVTIVHRDEHLLSREDQDVAEEIAKIFQKEGIEVLFNTETLKVEAPEAEKTVLTVKTGDQEQLLEGSHLLIATGRIPNTVSLNLKSTGIEVDKRGFIPVNDQLETAVPGIFAIGDVNGGPAFTHISYDDFRILRTNLLDGGTAVTSGRPVPYVVFIDPQLGRIGITEKEAKELGYEYRVAKIPMTWAARALETDETAGMMKAIVDAKTDRILGAAILSVEGGEVMAVLQVAMLGGLSYTLIRDGIFAHPTLAESLNTLFGTLES